MNYQLLANRFPAVSIAKEDRLEYFNTLEAYAAEGDLTPFAELAAICKTMEDMRDETALEVRLDEGKNVASRLLKMGGMALD